ncbi:MAG: hypothetical protein NT138_26435 [Planctomycetales bacterium]|nr:hypothetical protein [Planctomycetales bacterium]
MRIGIARHESAVPAVHHGQVRAARFALCFNEHLPAEESADERLGQPPVQQPCQRNLEGIVNSARFEINTLVGNCSPADAQLTGMIAYPPTTKQIINLSDFQNRDFNFVVTVSPCHAVCRCITHMESQRNEIHITEGYRQISIIWITRLTKRADGCEQMIRVDQIAACYKMEQNRVYNAISLREYHGRLAG